jgi:hypothetical protein
VRIHKLTAVHLASIGSLNNIDQFTSAMVKGGYAEDPSYAKGVKEKYADLMAGNTPLPPTGNSTASNSSGSQSQSFTFDHSITLKYPSGMMAAAAPLTVTNKVGAPSAFGSSN